MQTFRLSLSILALCVVGIVLTSCKDDDEVPVKPKLSFSEASATYNEADGIIEIEVELDNPAPADIIIDYELGGTALDVVQAGSTASPDYEVIGDADYGEIEIAQGATTGIIEIELYSDLAFEDDEVIEISLTEASSDQIEITRDDEIEITLLQENGMITFLEWGVGEGENYTNVDMDLFLWLTDPDTEELFLTNIFSASESFESGEYLFIPDVADDGTYGFSYNYYAGFEGAMNFQVTFLEFEDGALEAEADWDIFNATYSTVNINPWFESEVLPLLSQTYVKTGGDYSNFSEITIHEAGSRKRKSELIMRNRSLGSSIPLRLQQLQ